jgi:hypothetical protein
MPRLAHFGVFIIGNRGSLRNPHLEHTVPAHKFVSPVFLDPSTRLGLREALIEFTLNGRRLSLGERGCSQAHINVRREILNSKFDWVLVLEDDVSLPENINGELNKIVNSETLSPSVVLLNTDSYFDIGPDLREISLKPSLANAFLIHREVLERRPFAWLEKFEIADWPISFSGVDFYTISNLASESGAFSLIGARPRGRLAFLISIFCRFPLLPLGSFLTGVPIWTLANWTLLAPVKRDLVLRFRGITTAHKKGIST